MQPGDVVRSRCGHDKEQLFFVVRAEPPFVYLANGRTRRAEKPKKKREKHVTFLAASSSRAAEKLRNGLTVTNRELRGGLNDFLLAPTEASESAGSSGQGAAPS